MDTECVYERISFYAICKRNTQISGRIKCKPLATFPILRAPDRSVINKDIARHAVRLITITSPPIPSISLPAPSQTYQKYEVENPIWAPHHHVPISPPVSCSGPGELLLGLPRSYLCSRRRIASQLAAGRPRDGWLLPQTESGVSCSSPPPIYVWETTNSRCIVHRLIIMCRIIFYIYILYRFPKMKELCTPFCVFRN